MGGRTITWTLKEGIWYNKSARKSICAGKADRHILELLIACTSVYFNGRISLIVKRDQSSFHSLDPHSRIIA